MGIEITISNRSETGTGQRFNCDAALVKSSGETNWVREVDPGFEAGCSRNPQHGNLCRCKFGVLE